MSGDPASPGVDERVNTISDALDEDLETDLRSLFFSYVSQTLGLAKQKQEFGLESPVFLLFISFLRISLLDQTKARSD